MSESRIQYRAICPACFNQQALRGDRLVDHGYTIPQAWHQRTGSCAGVNEPHFGTPAGRDVTIDIIRSITAFIAKSNTEIAALAEAKQITVKERVRFTKEYVEKTYTKSGTPVEFREAIRKHQYLLESHIRQAESSRKDFQDRVDAWTAVAPVEVKTETKVPTVHGDGSYYDKRAAFCSGSAMGARRSLGSRSEITGDWSRVTCARCLKLKAEHDARAAKKAAEKAAK
jgi:hypothetical protein